MKGYFKENWPPSTFFSPQRLDKLEQFGKRPQACRMIVSHANNHLLTLSEFASDKANYHLKMSSKTLWAKSLHHDSQLYYRGYITARTYTLILTNMQNTLLSSACELAAGTSYECSDLTEELSYCCILLKLVFSQSHAASASFSDADVTMVPRHFSNFMYK